jgi:hypothetical protein
LRFQGHGTALWLEEPRGRRTPSWSLAPMQGGVGSLPEMTVELGDYFTRRRLPPASQSLPSQLTTRVTAPGPSDDGGSTGDGTQAQGMRTRKHSAADTDSDAPPAKKGRGQAHGQQLPSGAAKGAQKRKAPREQPPLALGGVMAGKSKYRVGWMLVQVVLGCMPAGAGHAHHWAGALLTLRPPSACFRCEADQVRAMGGAHLGWQQVCAFDHT